MKDVSADILHSVIIDSSFESEQSIQLNFDNRFGIPDMSVVDYINVEVDEGVLSSPFIWTVNEDIMDIDYKKNAVEY